MFVTRLFTRACLLACLVLIFCSSSQVYSAIIPTGNYTPVYNGIDNPWVAGSELTISQFAPGTLTITDGSEVTAPDARIGNNNSSFGTVTITGVGSQLTASSNLLIGRSGVADVYINDGGTLSGYRTTVGEFTGSVGTVTVSDAGSSWISGSELTIGKAGDGVLSIINGGAVVSNSVTRIGYELQSVSTADVSGTGSTLDVNGGLYVGWGGVATLDIQDGGAVTSNKGYIAHAVGSIGRARVQGSGAVWEATSGFIIAQGGEGGLIVEGGADLIGYNGVIARNKGSMGVVTIDGAGSTWNNTNGLVVGESGTATLNIVDGAVVNNGGITWVGTRDTGSGRIVFDDGVLNTSGLFAAPSELPGVGVVNTTAFVSDIDLVFDQSNGLEQQIILNNLPGQNILINLDASDPAGVPALGAGYRGSGSLTIADGRIMNSGFGMLATRTGSTATATIGGVGTAWHIDEGLVIGNEGAGMLITQGGAEITANRVDIGFRTGSSGAATVSGSQSRWDIDEFLFVGLSGAGTLLIEQGGEVVSDFRVIIGGNQGATGTATITGDGSSWFHTGEFNVGWSGVGTGTLNIESGALLDITGGLFMKSPQATVNLAGGTLIFHGEWSSRDPQAIISGGTFNFTAGRLEGADRIVVQQPFIQQGGTIAPGNSIGETIISGDYVLASGTIEIELGGAGNPHDVVTVANDIEINLLGTTLDLRPVGIMAAGTYTLIESDKGNLTGMFEQITGIAMYAGLVDMQYTLNAVAITLNWDFVPGDLDGDGFVGIADLNIILAGWNQAVAQADLLAGDVTGDGFVGISDLNAVLTNWNSGTPPLTQAISNVPEPGTIGVLLVLAGGIIGNRHRRL
jgi:T5SS/PEP-CTERM-associated repeat protein